MWTFPRWCILPAQQSLPRFSAAGFPPGRAGAQSPSAAAAGDWCSLSWRRRFKTRYRLFGTHLPDIPESIPHSGSAKYRRPEKRKYQSRQTEFARRRSGILQQQSFRQKGSSAILCFELGTNRAAIDAGKAAASEQFIWQAFPQGITLLSMAVCSVFIYLMLRNVKRNLIFVSNSSPLRERHRSYHIVNRKY